MKADEIRNIDISSYSEKMDLGNISLFMREIAAQLADLNEHLRLVDESVFGSPKEKKNDSKRISKAHSSGTR